MGDESKHEAFRTYRERKVLVNIDEAISLVRKCEPGFTYEGQRDIYPHKPLKYRTVESMVGLS